MIRYLDGDLTEFPHGIEIIAHSCNCQNKMGAGIAKVIKEKYPLAYSADSQAFLNQTSNLGNFSYARVTKPPLPARYVYNLYTQFNVGRDRRYVSYDAFDEALRHFSAEILHLQEDNNRKITVGLPFKMSSMNAGGSWKVISALIEDVFENKEFDVVVVFNPLYDTK